MAAGKCGQAQAAGHLLQPFPEAQGQPMVVPGEHALLGT